MSAADFAPPIGDPPSIELIPPRRLLIDASYQRAITATTSQTQINQIARAWDWRLCVPLLVSRRADGLYVIDGQHRLEGARKRGDIAYLPCCVSEYGSPAEEAATFVAANRKRRAVNRVDTFRAAVLAGDPASATIQRLLDQAGLSLSRVSGTNRLGVGELNCIVALLRLLKSHGRERLAAAIGTIAEAFGGQILFYAAPMIDAVCLLLSQRPDPDSRAALVATLRIRTPRAWFDHASRRPGGANGGKSSILAMKSVIGDALERQQGLSATTPAPPPAKRPRTFDEQMAAVAVGAKLVTVAPLRKPAPSITLGGVASGML